MAKIYPVFSLINSLGDIQLHQVEFGRIFLGRMKMKKVCVLLLLLALSLGGCDYTKNKKYSGKVFDVRVEYWEGDRARPKIWKNANQVSYDSEENEYTFYVDGKLVVLDGYSPIVLTEVGSIPPVSPENELYLGKKFDLSIIDGKDIVKTWKNIEIKSIDSKRIHFLFDHQLVNVIPSVNETIIIEEVK